MRLTEQKKRKTKFFLFCFVQGHLTINNKKNKRKGVLFVRGFSFWRLSLKGMLIKLHATRHFSGSCPDVRPPPNKFVSPCNNTKHFQKKYFYISYPIQSYWERDSLSLSFFCWTYTDIMVCLCCWNRPLQSYQMVPCLSISVSKDAEGGAWRPKGILNGS